MEFSTHNLVTIDQIKADILIALNDEEEKLFNSGFYISQIQQALQELSFDTFFLKLHKDFVFPTETLSLDLPEGAFNVREVFVFNGENCNISSSKLVWHKTGYITNGKNKGSTSRNKEGNSDYFIENYNSSNWVNQTEEESSSSDLLFCTIANGRIMFSSSCGGYDNVRLEYNGIQTNIGSTPFIPIQFREAVKLFVEEKCLRYLRSRNPRFYSALWRDVYNILHAPFEGIWDKAKYRSKIMDTKESQDLKEYLSKMNY